MTTCSWSSLLSVKAQWMSSLWQPNFSLWTHDRRSNGNQGIEMEDLALAHFWSQRSMMSFGPDAAPIRFNGVVTSNVSRRSQVFLNALCLWLNSWVLSGGGTEVVSYCKEEEVPLTQPHPGGTCNKAYFNKICNSGWNQAPSFWIKGIPAILKSLELLLKSNSFFSQWHPICTCK